MQKSKRSLSSTVNAPNAADGPIFQVWRTAVAHPTRVEVELLARDRWGCPQSFLKLVMRIVLSLPPVPYVYPSQNR